MSKYNYVEVSAYLVATLRSDHHSEQRGAAGSEVKSCVPSQILQARDEKYSPPLSISFQCLTTPTSLIGSSRVSLSQESQQEAVRIARAANDVIGQDEL